MDLYALLGIEEKAADKEVRTVARRACLERSGSPSCLDTYPAAGTRFPGSTRPWAGSEGRLDGLRRWAPRPFQSALGASRGRGDHRREAPRAWYSAVPLALV